MVLIYPPVAKPCEPPPGLARLAGALCGRGVPCTLVDGNVEALHFLLGRTAGGNERGLRSAERNLDRNIRGLKGWDLYANRDRYRRAVYGINRLLEEQGALKGVKVSICDYGALSSAATDSGDLLRAARTPETNPFFDYFEHRLGPLLAENRDGIVGFSLNFLSQALTGFAMAGFVRRRFPASTIVMGGGLVTSWMKRPGWHNPFAGLVDLTVAGPGEGVLLSLAGVEGDGSYSPPAYDGFPIDAYLAPGLILPYNTSFGCYWNRCSFCPERAEGNPYIQVPAEQVVEDLKALALRYRPALIHLTDNAVSPRVMRAIASDPPGVPWYGFARVTSHLTDPAFCRSLKKAGCAMLKLGVESGDQGVLDRLSKGTRLENVERALETLKAAGISTYVYLLFGTPAEDEEEARRTLRFVAARSNRIDFLNVAIFNLPVNSHEASSLTVRPFYRGDLSLYAGFVHPAGWDRVRVRRFVDRDVKRHPAIQQILRNRPPFFTSNHAPLMILSKERAERQQGPRQG